MPDESLLRYFLIEVLLEGSTWFVGKLGRGVIWLVTVGKVDVDEESWSAVIVGALLVFATIVALTVWQWGAD